MTTDKREGWIRGNSGPVRIKNKTYKNLVSFTRPCATCHENFSIFVTPTIADNDLKSNSFGLRNCERHRRNKSEGGDPATVMANATMKEELTGLYTRCAELGAMVNELKGKLAQYELQGAMEKVATQQKMPWE